MIHRRTIYVTVGDDTKNEGYFIEAQVEVAAYHHYEPMSYGNPFKDDFGTPGEDWMELHEVGATDHVDTLLHPNKVWQWVLDRWRRGKWLPKWLHKIISDKVDALLEEEVDVNWEEYEEQIEPDYYGEE